ncbi:hypothetical protein THRCLA_11417 [Thraustotheca clavata]|uniref:MtN3-like protein n=1 Tax=Thraustotheca clavata TaxID=74557 RepID=A0A1V9Y7Y3_9STRA|nr:hypothetical protein THRCLA_11417 [Thraustotheca clavata]
MVEPPALWVNALGFGGGILLSICTVPQIYSIIRTKSAQDVSLVFTIMYFIGVATSASYMFLIQAYAGAWPLAAETFFGGTLCVLVTYYTRIQRAPYMSLGHNHHGFTMSLHNELKLMQTSLELAIWFQAQLEALENELDIDLAILRTPMSLVVSFKAPTTHFTHLYPFVALQANLAHVTVAAPIVVQEDLERFIEECRQMGKRAFESRVQLSIQTHSQSYQRLID